VTWPNINVLATLSNRFILEGNGKSIIIKPTTLNVPWYGLMNLNGGKVQNLFLYLDSSTGTVNFAKDGMGALIGNMYSSGTLNGVLVSGFNISTTGSGGLVGSYSTCTIVTCQTGVPGNYTTVSGTGAGGAAGSNFEGTITNCVFYTNVSGNYAGGAVGNDSLTFVEKCITNGTISGNYAGGLVGADHADGSGIFNCYSLCTVNKVSAGGFIGNDSRYLGKIYLFNNYFLGNVISGTSLGVLENGNQLEMNNFASNTNYDQTNKSQSLLCSYNFEKFLNLSNFIGVNGTIRTVALSDQANLNIYIGGDFTSINGQSRDNESYLFNRVAKYDMVLGRWNALGNGVNGRVWDIHIYDASYIFIGGEFTSATQRNGTVVTCNRIVQFNQYTVNFFSMSNITPGVNTGQVRSLVTKDDYLYVGGSFTQAGGNVNVSSIARWGPLTTTPTWSAIGPSATGSGTIISLCVSGNNIFMGGTFNQVTDADGIKYCNNITKWNLTSQRFEYLGLENSTNNGVNNTVNSIVADENGEEIWVGGAFTITSDSFGKKGYQYLANWNFINNEWNSPLNIGIGNEVSILYIVNNQLHIGGSFTTFLNSNLNKNYYLMYDISTGRFYSYNFNLYKVILPFDTTLGNIYGILKINGIIYVFGSFTTFGLYNDGSGALITDVYNIGQLNTTYNITNYTNVYPSTSPPIVNFNS
jgi:hypothetical protein